MFLLPTGEDSSPCFGPWSALTALSRRRTRYATTAAFTRRTAARPMRGCWARLTASIGNSAPSPAMTIHSPQVLPDKSSRPSARDNKPSSPATTAAPCSARGVSQGSSARAARHPKEPNSEIWPVMRCASSSECAGARTSTTPSPSITGAIANLYARMALSPSGRRASDIHGGYMAPTAFAGCGIELRSGRNLDACVGVERHQSCCRLRTTAPRIRTDADRRDVPVTAPDTQRRDEVVVVVEVVVLAHEQSPDGAHSSRRPYPKAQWHLQKSVPHALGSCRREDRIAGLVAFHFKPWSNSSERSRGEL